jgi:uncharacterized protein YqeY
MAKVMRILLVGTLVAAVGACGGSSYKGLSKADYTTKADAICAAGNKKLDAASKTLTPQSSLADFQKLYREDFASTTRDEITQLRALKPPKADRAKLSKMLDDLSTGVDQLVAEVGGAKSISELSKLKQPDSVKSATTAAKAYGLTACGAGN